MHDGDLNVAARGRFCAAISGMTAMHVTSMHVCTLPHMWWQGRPQADLNVHGASILHPG